MNMMTMLRKSLAVMLLAAPLAAPAAPEPVIERPGHFTDGDLDALLAPIALYPDTVLSHVLIAATYPDDVFEAADWTRAHRDLQGEAAVDAVEGKDWDASVKALVAFPEILERMDEDRDWTEDLGDAFVAQEGDVMDRVQVLRDKADESGHLDDLEHVRVVREKEVIYLEPAVREVVYVPYYDPWVVYGDWWWPAYPPHRWAYWYGHPVGYYSLHSGFWWGVHFAVAPRFYFSSCNWPSRRVVVINRAHGSTWYSGRDIAHHREARHWQDVRMAQREHGRTSWKPQPRDDGRGSWKQPHDNGRASWKQASDRQPRQPGGWDRERREWKKPPRTERREVARREDRREGEVGRREDRVERREDRADRREDHVDRREDHPRPDRNEQRPEPRPQRQERERNDRPERQQRPQQQGRPQRQERGARGGGHQR